MAALVGAIHFLMGLLDLGAFAEIFSQPLLRGRTAAAACLVLISQVSSLTGAVLPPDRPAPSMPLQRAVVNLAAVPTRGQIRTSLLSLGLAVTLIGLKKLDSCRSDESDSSIKLAPSSDSRGKRFQRRFGKCFRFMLRLLAYTANLITLVLGSICYHFLNDPEILLLDTFNPPRLAWNFPSPSLKAISAVIPTAALTAFLTFGGHLTVAERMRREQDSWNPRRELLSLGLCGFASASIGGMPVMANLAICQAVQQCIGSMAIIGNTAGHILAFWSVASLPALQQVPKCAVSVIVIVEFAPLLFAMPREVGHLLRQANLNADAGKRSIFRRLLGSDLGIYMVAFLSPLIWGIIYGSLLAVGLEVVLSVSRLAGADFDTLGRIPGTDTYDEIGVPGSRALPIRRIVIQRPAGPRWFLNAAANTRASRKERKADDREEAVVIADWRMVPFLDETALCHYKREWSSMGVKVLVTNTCSHVRRQIQESGLGSILQQSEETLVDLHKAVLWAENYIETLESSQVTIGVRERHASTTDESSPMD
eukprot:TRINITY_DN81521_c0_g1_i1.p1 TRINITY_DN81521_c0_g1~~TRINITY_DN81521_c0_g1_i1.p1  ORF type:complete len:549 (-),score=89.65 TRINITY_DN81521_c0_g1_i1:56-1666(-)